MQCFIREVRSGIITCGRAWTTVSSSALIPVAIFNSFSTVRESEKERELQRVQQDSSVCVHVYEALIISEEEKQRGR